VATKPQTQATQKRGNMKALSQQICEIQDALTAKKISFREAVKPTKSEEQRLSVLKGLLADNGIKESAVVEIIESARHRKITRNNGSGVVVAESDREKRIRSHMARRHCSWKEASIFVTGALIPEPGDKKSELAEAWKRYCPTLKPHEIDALANRNVPVPER
jgi:hypothetical protein